MEIRKNKVKEYFRKDQTTVGIWSGIPHPYAAEICAGAGFDWVLIDGEHAPYDINSILTAHQAMSNYDTGIVVRIPSKDPVLIKRLLDLGIQTLLVPMVETAEEAENLVKAISYPPKGIRGIGSALSRAAQWKRVPDYFSKVQDELCLILQVESVKGMENIESICEVEGVDGIFIGPADLAGSMGMIGQPMDDKVRAEVKRGLKIISSHNRVPGVLAVTEPVFKEYIAAGAKFIGVGVDLIALAKATTAMAKKFKIS